MTAPRRARSGRPTPSGRVTPKGTQPRQAPKPKHVFDGPARPTLPHRGGPPSGTAALHGSRGPATPRRAGRRSGR